MFRLKEVQEPRERHKLLGPEGFYMSETPGTLGGYKAVKRMGPHRDNIYGRLDCPTALRVLSQGGYEDRVFFADEETAIAAGFRPCYVCLRERYDAWKAGGEAGSEAYPWLVTP